MVTLSLKSETTNAKGKMNPCHNPSQKPATEPSAPGEFLKKFGPAVQPAAKHRVNTRTRPKTASSGFFMSPPELQRHDLSNSNSAQLPAHGTCGDFGEGVGSVLDFLRARPTYHPRVPNTPVPGHKALGN